MSFPLLICNISFQIWKRVKTEITEEVRIPGLAQFLQYYRLKNKKLLVLFLGNNTLFTYRYFLFWFLLCYFFVFRTWSEQSKSIEFITFKNILTQLLQTKLEEWGGVNFVTFIKLFVFLWISVQQSTLTQTGRKTFLMNNLSESIKLC